MKADALRCDYCNGFVNPTTYKCPYCGTQYVKPRSEPFKLPDMKIVSVNAPVEVLGVCRDIDMYDYKTMVDMGIPVEQKVREDMAHQIAEAIADKMEIYEDFDIVRREKRFIARLRVVKPDYKF